MKGKKLGAQKKGEVERAPGKQSGGLKGVQGFKRVWTSSTQRSVSQRVLTQIGSADYAAPSVILHSCLHARSGSVMIRCGQMECENDQVLPQEVHE